MDEYSLWLHTNVSSARQDQVRAFADDLAPPPAAEDNPSRRAREKKKPCFGGASVETLEAIESRFLGATLPAQ